MKNNNQQIIISKTLQILYKINNNNNIFLIFGISNCKYCNNSKDLLNLNFLQYKFYNVEKYRNIFISILHELNNFDNNLNIDLSHQTFPAIFYNQKFIGGYTQLEKFIKK